MPSARFYIDENLHGPITEGLRRRGVDVLTVQEDGHTGLVPDDLVLDRAGELGRLMVTQDKDFLEIAARRWEQQVSFTGIIYMPKDKSRTAIYIEDLEMIAGAGTFDEYQNRVEYLPFPRPEST